MEKKKNFDKDIKRRKGKLAKNRMREQNKKIKK